MSYKGFNPKYDDNKVKDTIYVGKKLSPQTENGKEHRIVEMIIDTDNTLSEKEIGEKKEYIVEEKITLYETKGGEQKYCGWLIRENDENILTGLRISRRIGKKTYGEQEVILNPTSIHKLKIFLNQIHLVDMDDPDRAKIKLPNKKYDEVITDDMYKDLLLRDQSSVDIIKKIATLRSMELGIEKLRNIIYDSDIREIDIQKFLRENIWMFGNEYTFIVEQEKINAKNILDIIPKNIENYIDVIEVKLPKETIINFDSSHKNYYPSASLTKAIYQTQNYIFELEKMTIDDKYKNSNNCKIIKPKGIVLIGSKEDLTNSQKEFLRLLNSSFHNIQVITYQQLLERAENIYNLQQ